MEDKIRAFVLSVLQEKMHLPINPETITDNVLLGQGGVDLESLAFVELTAHVEHEFGVKFTDAAFEKLAGATLGDFSREVVSMMSARG